MLRNAPVSQPAPYNRSFSFRNFQAANPTGAIPGSQVDGELNNVKTTLDQTLANLARIQRDDGCLKNASVTFDSLSPSLQTAGLAPALPWVTAFAYTIGASVTHGSAFYRCLAAHTSGVFAADLTATKWVLIIDFSTIALVAASMIAVTPSGTLTSDAQTSLQALDAGKAATSHTHPSSAISDSTAAGRALLTAADATAQNVLLGTTALGFQSGDVKETAVLVLQSGWYYCDGSSKNRVTDVNLFNAITIQQSGVLTSASAVVTGLTDTSSMSPGMPISGTGVQSATQIQSVDSSTQITMTTTATTSATTSLVIAPYGVGDGSTTFGLPNRAQVAVGRDNASGSATNVFQVSTTISTTSGSNAATVGSAAGLAVGMYVASPKVVYGTAISAISGTNITLNANALGTGAGAACQFSAVPNAQTLGARAGTLTQTLVQPQLPNVTLVMNGVAPTVTVSGRLQSDGAARTGGTTFMDQLQASGGGGTTTQQYTVAMTGVTVALGGLGQAHLNVQPTIVMNYIIKR
jgi:microcystin-dependent protein